MNISSGFNNFANANFHHNFSKNQNMKEQISSLENLNKTDHHDKSNETEKKDKNSNDKELSKEEELQVSKLRSRDSEVKAHEAAHIAASGGLASGGANYTYQQGPDGRMYAIGGEVSIDTSKGSTHEETIAKMQKVKAAATAPANPSGKDTKVASTAAVMEMQARIDLSKEKQEEIKQKASKAYDSSQQTDYNSLLLSA